MTRSINRTELLARGFVYTDKSGGHTTRVSGSVEDDLRYRLDASVDGNPAASEVVYDDARALQVQDESLLAGLVRSPSGNAVTLTGEAGVSAAGAPVSLAQLPAPLQSGQWVVDKAGATGLTVTSNTVAAPGKDPLLDAVTGLEYVRQAMGEAGSVEKFNPESETYRPKLDPFPRPQQGVIRYDLVPPALPQPQSGGAGGVPLSRPLPATPFFRLLAVYVRDGKVVEVRERINVAARLSDQASNLEARLGEFVKAPAGASISQQANLLLRTLNRQLQLRGQIPIRERDMDLKFSGLGRAQPVQLPAGATDTDLAALGVQGQVLYEHR